MQIPEVGGMGDAVQESRGQQKWNELKLKLLKSGMTERQ
jgi:hypothetical protein